MNVIQFKNKSIFPSKIVCIGRNYAAHIEELKNDVPDEPVIFIKPNSAIADKIILTEDEEIHYEAEICFLIKNGELSAVGFGLDLTKRQVQKRLKEKGLPWERAKAFDGSALFSEFIKPDVLLKEIKRNFTLEDGDIIMTGTPAGVGKINENDDFVGKIFSDSDLLVDQSWVCK